MRLRAWLAPVMLVTVSVSVALVAVEGALRVVDWFPPPPQEVETARPDLYMSDPVVGYRMWPGKDTIYQYPVPGGEWLPLRANGDGFRSPREFGEPDDRIRVAFFGDSFIFGEGVRVEDRISEVVEMLQPEWRVDAVGMPGWGVDMMVRALEAYGPRLQPDVVVLSVYTDDFRRLHPYNAGVGFYGPKFDLVDGELVSYMRTPPGFFERTRLAQAVIRRYWADRVNRYDLNEALLDRFRELADEQGFRPVVIFIPGRDDNNTDKTRRAFLADWAERHQVPFQDLTDPIHGAGVDQVYITGNWHWNAAGHRLAAEEILPMLTREVAEVAPPG